jgi:Putative beta-lactamase-inhibitor-like, PepSY-like
MRKIIASFCMLLFVVCSYAATPPESVKKTFNQKYPTATKVKWGMEKANEWEAEFIFNGEKLAANFKEDGTWVETEHKIKFNQLPMAVAEAYNKTFLDWKIIEVDRTETVKNGVIYEIDMKKGKEKKTAAYKEDGTVVIE